ncbi:MAG: DUF5996 family protein [Ignavibacteria bacterium]|jgi:hypothetical protein
MPLLKGSTGKTFELKLDLIDHQLQMHSEDGITSVFLASEEVKEFAMNIKRELEKQNVNLDEKLFDEIKNLKTYNKEIANKIFRVFRAVDLVLKEFKGSTFAYGRIILILQYCGFRAKLSPVRIQQTGKTRWSK